MQTYFTIQDESIPSLRTYIDVKWDPTVSHAVLRISTHNRKTDTSQYETIPLPQSNRWTVRDIIDYLDAEIVHCVCDTKANQEEMLDTMIRDVPVNIPGLLILV